ncbi:MAG: chromosome segregation protein SMC [Armatimonadota bacterium]|nr:MAG: chromosome segregation protein SMC [Armatimonadota bacterium]
MQKRGTSGYYISQLRVENWRNFTLAEVILPRRVFLVGPNASGKSNFLDILRFLRDLVSVGGGFQEAVRRRGGVSRLRSLSARRYSDIGLVVTVSNEDGTESWCYTIRYNQDNLRRPVLREEHISHDGQVLLDRPDEKDKDDPERLTQTYLEQVNVNRPFRTLADVFASISYLHIVPQLIREPDRSVGRHHDPYGGDFLERIAQAPERTRQARLRRIQDALRLAVPQLNELQLYRDERGTPHLKGNYQHWRPRGAWLSEQDFSDGTLRLIGLLWVLQDGTGPLLLEEPELYLHPEVIRYIPQMFARVQRRTRRQIIVSTHSADLLQDSGIGLDEVLLFFPEDEGTVIRRADEFGQVKTLLEQGTTLSEIVIPMTRPERAHQLGLFEGV